MLGGTLEYLMSSLPNLSFQNTDEARNRVLGLLDKYAGPSSNEINPADILDGEAQKFLPAPTFHIFQKINLRNIHIQEFQQSKISVLSNFSKFIFTLRNELQKVRLSQKENDSKSSKTNLEKLIGQGTPLEKEFQIMKYEWEKLEELSVGHYTDIEALTIYKIKLLILLRWWSFNIEKGFGIFTKLTTNN